VPKGRTVSHKVKRREIEGERVGKKEQLTDSPQIAVVYGREGGSEKKKENEEKSPLATGRLSRKRRDLLSTSWGKEIIAY